MPHTIPDETKKLVQISDSCELSCPIVPQAKTGTEILQIKGAPRYSTADKSKEGINHKTHQCPECSRTFPNPSSLAYHHTSHLGFRDYQCHLCPRTYKYSSTLYKHLKRKHPDAASFPKRLSKALSKQMQQSGYKCSQCEKCYLELHSLRRHQKHVHTDEDRVVCEECGLSFLGRCALKYHITSVHTNEDPLICNQCSKVFTYSTSLKRHKSLLHKSE
ncbi:zinc finger, C2H2 type [Opisthorchis viverrini]|uniref:Zinc finger, C2H2 type n=1 Tax=Opisthorchis viverrini TaxID=6198 RepID=A0A1S8WQD9_OPIVI|nr:zinc finger, C2H2 type [Opisthorchis viverrini]